jgi:ferredoxin--NADP+ reductase/benzoate/toluate 1,2-dioxygenase reductase subunit
MNSIKNQPYKVVSIRELTPSTYSVRINRNGLPFKAGQHISLGPIQGIDLREYSVYSSEQDPFFEVLIREVIGGNISRKLKRLKPGDAVHLEGPVGYFNLNKDDINEKKFVFIATGTGIAPFHSFVKSYPNLDYQLIHGVKTAIEAYDRQDYDSSRHVLCTSQDKKGDFNGRVTQYLQQQPVDKDALYYLCGNINMIYEVFHYLQEKEVPASNLHTEVYF